MFGYCDDENMNDFSMEDLNEFQMATTNLNHDSALHLIESLSSSSSESNM